SPPGGHGLPDPHCQRQQGTPESGLSDPEAGSWPGEARERRPQQRVEGEEQKIEDKEYVARSLGSDRQGCGNEAEGGNQQSPASLGQVRPAGAGRQPAGHEDDGEEHNDIGKGKAANKGQYERGEQQGMQRITGDQAGRAGHFPAPPDAGRSRQKVRSTAVKPT